MCGIIGYAGDDEALPILLSGLHALEYRGYDSAGIAVSSVENGIQTVKAEGRLSALCERTAACRETLTGKAGIGHTRWATHGSPAERNAHPHTARHLALVHNGIIENDREIGDLLEQRGYTFLSETDTERAAKLLDLYYGASGDPMDALWKTADALRGAYAFAVIFRDRPRQIYCLRRDSPLVLAETETGVLVASDVTALLPHTRSYFRLPEGVVAVLDGDERRVTLYGRDGETVKIQVETADFTPAAAEKGGYDFFMQKEIAEEPEAVRRTVQPRIRDGSIRFGLPMLDGDGAARIRRIHLVACGTAMHAGLVGRRWIEDFAGIPASVSVASEFRYEEPILSEGDLVLLLSQSGETSDTLAALRHARQKGIPTLAIVNVVGSAIAGEADGTLYTYAGPEIAVASTKAYTVQCALLYLLALRLGGARGRVSDGEVSERVALLTTAVPASIAAVLRQEEEIASAAAHLASARDAFYIGRLLDADLAAEGSLKLKEISYIHSEAYPAGELKHGTISLIVEGVPVIALLTEAAVAEKTVSGIREVLSRGGDVTVIASEALVGLCPQGCRRIVIPTVGGRAEVFPAATALQLLACHVARRRGLDVDKPRNLAKSVTVE